MNCAKVLQGKHYLSSFAKKPFVRNVAVVASGTAMAQFITMAFSPVITRLYGPEAFGMLGTFMALLAVVTPIAALTYPIAIVLPKEDSEAKEIASLSMYISFAIATVLLVLVLIGGDWLVGILQVEDIEPFILLIPLVVVLAAWLQVNQQWLIRKQLFNIQAKVAVLQALIVNSSKSGAGLFAPVGAVLIVIAAMGQMLHAVMLYWGLKKSRNEKYKEQSIALTENKDYSTLARKYSDFGLYRAPQEFLRAISTGLPVLLLASFFGPAAAGFYTIGNRVLRMPFGLIGKSIGNVYYPRIARASNNDESLKPYQKKATLGMAATAFIPVLVVIALGPVLFGFVFGGEWVVAGHYARWLAVMVFFEFILHPSKDAMIVLGMQKQLMVYELISMCIKISMLVAGFLFFKDDLYAIILFSLAGSVIGMILLLFMNFKVNRIVK